MFMVNVVAEWYGKDLVASFNEERVADASQRVGAMKVDLNTKSKRWGFIKRFIKHLASMRLILRPVNLDDKIFSFKKQRKEVKEYPLALVKDVIGKLPYKLRCWAMMGLNTGMTNNDIAQLRKDMVQDGYLTRRRVKTGANEKSLTVRYKLWPETLHLMNMFKSDDPVLWFTNDEGKPLIEICLLDGKVKETNGIGDVWKYWKKKKKIKGISMAKFRNAARQALEEHDTHSRYGKLFLAHVPDTVDEASYSNKNKKRFDTAVDWLRGQILDTPRKSSSRKDFC